MQVSAQRVRFDSSSIVRTLALCAGFLVLSRDPIARVQGATVANPKPVPAEVTTWLRERAVAIPEGHVGACFQEFVGDARVISFGDAACGRAKETLAFQCEFFRHGVEKLGVRVLAIDANATEVDALDDYVVGGAGEPQKLLDALHAPRWSSGEFKDAVAWMRAWNAEPAHANKLHVVGIDARYTSLAAQQVGDYIQRIDYESSQRVAAILTPLRQTNADGTPRYGSVGPELQYVTMVYLPELAAMLDDNREADIQASSEAEWRRAKRAVEHLIQAEAVLRAASEKSDEKVLERALADNVAKALDVAGSDGRVIVWTDLSRIAGALGPLLRERFDKDLVTIGLSIGRGTTAPDAADPVISTLEFVPAGVVPPRAWVDLRRLPSQGPVADWFVSSRVGLDAIVRFEQTRATTR